MGLLDDLASLPPSRNAGGTGHVARIMQELLDSGRVDEHEALENAFRRMADKQVEAEQLATVFVKHGLARDLPDGYDLRQGLARYAKKYRRVT